MKRLIAVLFMLFACGFFVGEIVKSLRPQESFFNLPTRVEIQEMLIMKGYDVGPVDGYIGKQTNKAWEKYEFDKMADGYIHEKEK